LERSCCLHVMPMLSKLECGVQGAVWRSCWACCPGVEGAAGYCPAADVPCRCCHACCPSAEGVASRVGCCLATAVPCRCCRVLLLFRPWGELLSMLSSAAECCCCPGCPAGAVQAWGKCCPCCPAAWFLVWRRKGAAAHVHELLGVEMVLLSISFVKGRIPLLVRSSSSFWTLLHVFLYGQVKERFVPWIC
jgi:hypothetical protein